MRLRLFMIIIINSVFCIQSAYAQSLASAMGDNVSVLASGAGDVARNPALLSHEIMPKEIGVFAGYRFFDKQNHHMDAEINISPFDVESGPIETYRPRASSIEGGMAFYSKFGKMAGGIAVSGKSEKDNLSFDLNLSISMSPLVIRNENVRNDERIAGYVSLSYEINRWLSVGLNGKLEYTNEYEDSESENYSNGSLSSCEFETTEKKSLINQGLLGIIIKNSAFQIGFLLVSPELSGITNGYENEKNDHDNPSNSYSISDSLPRQWLITSGLGFIAGIAFHVTENLSIAGECGFRISGSYEERMLVVDNKIYEETENHIDNKPFIMFSLGLRYRIDHSLSFACGAFSRFFSMENEYETTNTASGEEVEVSQFGIRFGMEKRIVSMCSIVIVGSAEQENINVKVDEQDTEGSYVFDNRVKEYSFNGTVAVRMFF